MSNEPEQPATAVTDLLAAWRRGEEDASDALFVRVYSELRRIAGAQVHLQAATMAPTELVHETYLKLLGSQSIDAADRGHFFSLAARAMRQILVDATRRRNAAKRGGGDAKVEFEEHLVAAEAQPELDLLALDEALDRLMELNPRLVQVVELRHFAGLSEEESAAALALSPRTVRRDWRTARAFLHAQLAPAESAPDGSAASSQDED